MICSASSPSISRQRLERVDRRAVDGGLAGLAQAAVADADAEALEQALERGRPAVHRRGLDHLGREERRASRSRRRRTTPGCETVQCRPGGSHPQPRVATPIPCYRRSARTSGRSRCVPTGVLPAAERACRRAHRGLPRPSRVPATPTSPTRWSSWGWCWRRAIACARRPAASARRWHPAPRPRPAIPTSRGCASGRASRLPASIGRWAPTPPPIAATGPRSPRSAATSARAIATSPACSTTSASCARRRAATTRRSPSTAARCRSCRAAIGMRSRRWPTTWAASSTRAATTGAPSRTRAASVAAARPRWSGRPTRPVAADVAALAAHRRGARPPGRGRRALRAGPGGVRARARADGASRSASTSACLAAVEQRRHAAGRARGAVPRGRSPSRSACSAATTPTSP